MPPKKVKKKKAPAKKEMSELKRRLISAALALLSLLIIVALMTGYHSISEDISQLKENGNIFGWFSGQNGDLQNPIGIFGAAVAFVFIYIFGYWFSLFAFVIIGFISLQYFVEPERQRGRQGAYFIILLLFFLQTLLAAGLDGYSQSVVPRFVWNVLAAVFKATGARIILIGSMVLSLVLVFDIQQLKAALQKLLPPPKEVKPTKPKAALAKEMAIEEPPLPPEPKPMIQDHVLSAQKEAAKTALNDKAEAKQVLDDQPDRCEDMSKYQMPSIEEFLESPVKLSEKDRKEIEAQILQTSSILQGKLGEFNIEAEVKNVNIGPIITQYELEPAKGIKVSRFASLADDLALAIKARSIRVQAPIPGRGLIGIEIPNKTRDMIYLKDLLLSEEMQKHESKLAFGLGKDIAGRPMITDLARMPHLLIAGTTGSGKSVCINTILMSLILRTTPDDMRLILIDPKRVELAGYGTLPHLIGEVVTDPDTALESLYWAVKEMERRYELLEEAMVREIVSYNEKVDLDEDMERLPYIVIVVDEFADLILTSGKDIELPITRLAQMARAVGIHLILATQRPSTKIITGMIKANFTARIAFQVSSGVDSRVVLDMVGAERLLGMGDMLFLPPGKGSPQRIHGAYVSDEEIARVNEYLSTQPKPRQDFSIKSERDGMGGALFDWDDELFPEAARVVVRANTASVSMLQRHFKIGYARAGRIIDLLERAQVVGPHLGSKSRDVLANRDDLIRLGVINEED